MHEKAVLHPMATLFPAAMAYAERKGGVSGRELIVAVAVGIDLAASLGVAAREGLKVILIEPRTHIGGMATGGLSRTDFGKKEVIGGYAILEAQSKAEAVELTRRFLKVHGTDWDVECEVRQLDGPELDCKP